MKLFIFLCFSQALLCALVCGHHGGPHDDDHDHHDEPHHKSESEALHQISTANLKFSYNFFYHFATSYPHDNFFYSPMSISIAFSLLSLGAKSKTLSQIHEGFCYNRSTISEEMIHKGFQNLLKIFKDQKDGFKLDMANALFTDNNLNLIEEFKDKAKKFYQSEAIATDFHKVQEAVEQINSYVEKKTYGNIKDLLDNLDPLTALVIINTIFFKGSWVDTFNVDHTREEDFHVDENTVVKVPMMTRQGEYNIGYISEAECTVVEVPYKGNITAIFIEIILSIPKFSISGEFDLVKELEHLGITDVFSDHADLSGITEDSRLKVSKAVHKAVLKVYEEGTEASAATTAGITKISLSLPQHITINRPFFISIFRKDISMEVFSGRIINPTK
ncbi:alpha-1-antitrypsin-like protein CM55-MS [Phyllobates terribilis]|uniref:alpha-1-antitrypsin-like protein CM55-MS n=1 Tax=Phyllobates terribilis TaxID=111132 RepID=UPI003CCB51AD